MAKDSWESNTLNNQEEILNSVPAILFLVDVVHETIDFINNSALRKSNITTGSISYKWFQQSITYPKISEQEFKKKLENSSILQLTFKTAEGNPVKLCCRLTTINQGKFLFTAFQTNTNEVENYKKLLEQKTAELRICNKEMDDFAYIASHDLQEPLRKLTTYIERLIDKLPKEEIEKTNVYTERIYKSSERMRKMIDDLLQFSRFGRQNLQFKEVNLNEIVQEAIIENELLIEEKNAQIIIQDKLPIIDGSFSQLQQLFYNLLNNSLKFIAKNTRPVISIQFKEEVEQPLNNEMPLAEQYCHITITDNGIGFRQEFSEKIFHLFYRLNAKFEYSGTGIGLAICKKIVQNHKGLLFASSQEGKGAEFNIVLPLKHIPYA